MEPTLTEVRTAIEAGNRAFDEFKAENTRRLEQLETRGVSDPLITEKLDKLNAAIDAQSAINERMAASMRVVDRLATMGLKADGTPEDRELARRSLNLSLRSNAIACGRQVVAELDADGVKAYTEAYETYCRRGESRLTDAERRALSVGTDPQGGYVVTPDTTGRIVKRLFETSPMRQFAASQPISSDALEGAVDLEEASVGWVSELGSRTASASPNVPVPWRIPVHEAYSMPKISQKNLEDAAIDLSAWHAAKTADKLTRLFNAAFVTGNGVGKPRGFASYTTAATADGSRSWGVFEHIATGSNGSFGTDPNGVNKLLDLIHAMKDGHAAAAAFFCNRTTLGAVRQLTDASSAGKYVFVPSFQAAAPDTLLGYPIHKLQDMATYTTTDALAIAFGDMLETYQIVDRLGITVLVDPYTAKPYVQFYTRARVGGDALQFDAMKFLKFGTS